MSSSSLKAVETDTDIRRSRTTLNRKYFKARAESVK